MLQQGNSRHANAEVESEEDFTLDSQEKKSLSEEELAMLYQKFIHLQKMKKTEEASIIASQLLYGLEKKYGSEHKLYCILSLDICKSLPKEKAIPILIHALGVLSPENLEPNLSLSDLSSCLKYSTSCCLQLANLLPGRESLPFTENVYQILHRSVCTYPDLEDAKQLYFLWASHLVLQYRPLGCWIRIEEVYKEFFSLTAYSKEDFLTMLDAYATALHQQGRTLEAIELFKQKQLANDDISDYSYNRLAKFYFFLDDFANCEQNILSLQEYYSGTLKFPELHLPLSSFNELMTACLELGKIEEYNRLEKQLKAYTPDPNRTPYSTYTRSKYLITLVANLNTSYRLQLKVCLKRPNRKEGELEKRDEESDRKLGTFYLEAFFDNPTEGEEPLHNSMSNSQYDFAVISPSFPEAAPFKWYSAKIFIYTDESKSVLLGKHFQLFYKEPYSGVV
jgi:tetratricopeptide (TPR) repeat protein